jgi:hypothetical protein
MTHDQREPQPAESGSDEAKVPGDDAERTLSTADLAQRADDERETVEAADAAADAAIAPDDRSAEAMQSSSAGDRPAASDEEERAPLFLPEDAEGLRERWNDIQTGFVDEPRATVKRADELVAELMKRLAESFAQERGDLEQQWDRGEEISTEDLRVTLRRYRSFFDRLLSV